MAKNTKGDGTFAGNTDSTVVTPDNMGKTLKFGNDEYNVNVGDTLTVTEQGLVNIKLSPDNGNLIEVRDNGLYYGTQAHVDTSNLYISSSIGDDSNIGTRESPLKTIREAFKRNRPNQQFTMHLFEDDTHEWRSSWGLKDNYIFNIYPYGSFADFCMSLNPISTVNWQRAQELKRPTIKFIGDKVNNNYSYFQTFIHTSETHCVFAGVRLVIDDNTSAPTFGTNGIAMGGSDGYLNLWFTGCLFELNDTHYFFVIGKSSNIVLDHCIISGDQKRLCHIETNGLLNLGFRTNSSGQVAGSPINGNTVNGTPTTLHYNGYTDKDVILQRFSGKTISQQVGIIY